MIVSNKFKVSGKSLKFYEHVYTHVDKLIYIMSNRHDIASMILLARYTDVFLYVFDPSDTDP